MGTVLLCGSNNTNIFQIIRVTSFCGKVQLGLVFTGIWQPSVLHHGEPVTGIWRNKSHADFVSQIFDWTLSWDDGVLRAKNSLLKKANNNIEASSKMYELCKSGRREEIKGKEPGVA